MSPTVRLLTIGPPYRTADSENERWNQNCHFLAGPPEYSEFEALDLFNDLGQFTRDFNLVFF